MTQQNFYELIQKEQQLIERLEKIIDKLENPMIMIEAEPVEDIFKDIEKIYNGEPFITDNTYDINNHYPKLKHVTYALEPIKEPEYLKVNFSPFTHLPVSIETDTNIYVINIKNNIRKEELQ